MKRELVDWICRDCAEKANVKCISEVVTVHKSLCLACCKLAGVTHIRDYGYPDIECGQFRVFEDLSRPKSV